MPTYVQYGCGFSVGEGWINFDSSPTLRIERIPVIGPVVGKLAGNATPFPKEVTYGDILSGLPVADNTVDGAYASHVLEHLSYNDFKLALRNTYRILAPGGVFRLIVPDLQERARRYVEEVNDGSAEANSKFIRISHLGQESRPRSFLGRVRAVYGNSNHLWMWDEPSMTEHLRDAGFVDIQRCEKGDSNDPMYDRVEDAARFVNPRHDLTELAMQARKPAKNGTAAA